MRLLDRLPALRADLTRAGRAGADATASAPADHRGQAYQLRGRAQRAEKVPLPPELIGRFDFDHYYRVLLALSKPEQSAIVFTRRVPAAWPLDQPLNEPVSACALFLKLAEPAASAPAPRVFAADRLAWFPDRAAFAAGIGPDQLELARLGLDLGLWDDIRDANHRPLESRDREAFYEVLAALLAQRQAEPPPRTLAAPLRLGSLLERPEQFQGTLQRVEGTARRITRVDVADPDLRRRLSQDHYYEIDLFLPLAGAKIRLGEKQPGQPAPEFANSFPATLVVGRLPAGLVPAPNLHEHITADAVFFKIWTYDSRYASRFGQVQPAPLFMAAAAFLGPPPPNFSWAATSLIALPVFLALIPLVAYLWVYTRAPRRKPTTSAPPPPDFSNLTKPSHHE